MQGFRFYGLPCPVMMAVVMLYSCPAVFVGDAVAAKGDAVMGVYPGKMMMELLPRGRRLDVRDQFGRSALYDAAERGRTSLAAILLRNGASVHLTDKWGWTPLHVAAWKGHREIVELLILAGADAEAKDHWGQTPLSLATWAKRRSVVYLLRSYGVRH